MKLLPSLAFTLLLPISSTVFAQSGLSGDWECTMTLDEASSGSATYTIQFDEKNSRFKRTATQSLDIKIMDVNKVEIVTIEEGTYSLTKAELRLSPLKFDYTIVKGKKLFDMGFKPFDKFKEDLVTTGLEDETNEITELTDTVLTLRNDEFEHTANCQKAP